MNAGTALGLIGITAAVHLLIWIAAAAIVPRRRTAGEAHAWLLIIALLPGLGVAGYAFHARTRVLRRARTFSSSGRAKSTADAAEHQANDGVDPAADPVVTMPDAPRGAATDRVIRRFDRLSERLPGARRGTWTRFDRLEPGLATAMEVVKNVETARASVDLEYFMLGVDPIGDRVRSALIDAADRGVRCRLLVDAAASRPLLAEHHDALSAAGVRVRRMSMVPYRLWPIRRIDLRNHRKLAIIDGRRAIVGSQNMDDRRRSTVPGDTDPAWLELSVRLEGTVVDRLADVFESDWSAAADESSPDAPAYDDAATDDGSPANEGAASKSTGRTASAETPPAPSLHVLPTGPYAATAKFEDVVHLLIDAAEHRVRIVTPYFVPTDPILGALRLALIRGVDVCIQVPFRIRPFVARHAALGYLADLRELGARVHLLPDGYLHAKLIAVDDDVRLFGSGNFDARSFWINRELCLLVTDAEATARIDEGMVAIDAAVQPWEDSPAARPGPLDTALRQWCRVPSPLL